MQEAPMPEPDEIVHLTVKQSGSVAVTSHVPAWVWRCEECGWLGTGWTSESGATKEGSDHLWNEHDIAVCGPEMYSHDGHRWEHVKGTDSVSRCSRCGWEIGK
jgi:predicted RNA-binding Zn-ribbon protein involved in translation (DUF1610 family)